MALPQRAKLAIAAWFETNTDFRLPNRAANLDNALESLANTPSTKSYLVQCEQLDRYFTRGVYLLIGLTFVLGLLAVPPAFAVSVSGKVNIFWLLIVLLGLHALNLVVWLIGMLALGRYPNHSPGFLLGSLIFINQKISKHSQINTDASTAFWHWQCPPHSNRWLFSTLSHGAWLSYLSAGFLMTLLLLLTNQVNFAWETTLLSEHQFFWLTQQLSIIPEWFGIPVPNQLDLFASRVDVISQTASTRQHWASLLLASLVFYGMIPRLILCALSFALYRFKRLTLPKTAQERGIERRYQTLEKSQILDADNAHKSNNTDLALGSLSPLEASAFQAAWGLYEWSQAIPKALSQANPAMLINNAEQQTAFLSLHAQEGIYLLVNGQISPDRGSRRFLTQAAQHHPDLHVVIASEQTSLFAEEWQRVGLESGAHANHFHALMAQET